MARKGNQRQAIELPIVSDIWGAACCGLLV